MFSLNSLCYVNIVVVHVFVVVLFSASFMLIRRYQPPLLSVAPCGGNDEPVLEDEKRRWDFCICSCIVRTIPISLLTLASSSSCLKNKQVTKFSSENCCLYSHMERKNRSQTVWSCGFAVVIILISR